MSVKTNVMRILEGKGIEYEPIYYDLGKAEFSGRVVAQITGVSPEQMYKTLTATGKNSAALVFVIPVDGELNLKKAAKAAGEKSVEMVSVKDLLKATGYLRGEVSPVGMKKAYPTFIDSGAEKFEKIVISAGKKGCSLWIAPKDLAKHLSASFIDLV